MAVPLQFDDIHREEVVDSSSSSRSRNFVEQGQWLRRLGRQDVRNAPMRGSCGVRGDCCLEMVDGTAPVLTCRAALGVGDEVQYSRS
jgi:hypothetical protein